MDDFLAEILRERTERNPAFPLLVRMEEARRRVRAARAVWREIFKGNPAYQKKALDELGEGG